MRIVVVGSGYVGLVSGTCFSEFGFEVTCVDADAEKIARLKKGISPIYEPGLEALMQKNMQAGRLHFTQDLAISVANADIVFIAVGTPSRRGDGHADLTYVFSAAEEIGAALQGETLVVTKSTVPVGTGRKVSGILRNVNPDALFEVASNPEFLREGSAIEDFMRPDRVIAGVESARGKHILNQLYRPLFLNETPIVFTDIETAELIKYAANSFLATKIAFINEMADLAEKLGANIQDVARGIGLDKRIGGKFLNPGPGYGGSCFPKDTLALQRIAEEVDSPLAIIEAVVKSNNARKQRMAQRVLEVHGNDAKGKKLAVLGLTFKPNTDDMRDSPSLVILPRLLAAGMQLSVFDPKGMDEARKFLPQGIDWHENAYDALEGADGLLILTEWNEFRSLDLAKVKRLLRVPLVVDFRNIYTCEEMRQAGLQYHSIGRPSVL